MIHLLYSSHYSQHVEQGQKMAFACPGDVCVLLHVNTAKVWIYLPPGCMIAWGNKKKVEKGQVCNNIKLLSSELKIASDYKSPWDQI